MITPSKNKNESNNNDITKEDDLDNYEEYNDDEEYNEDEEYTENNRTDKDLDVPHISKEDLEKAHSPFHSVNFSSDEDNTIKDKENNDDVSDFSDFNTNTKTNAKENNNINDNHNSNFKLKRLKKLGDIQKEKEEQRLLKIKKKRLMKNIFFENEADLGSDNEEHDDIVKNARILENEDYREDRKLQDLEDLGEAEFLEGLIDKDFDDKDLDEKEKIRLKRFIHEEELKEDRKRIKEIINFDHNKRKNKYANDEGFFDDDDEDNLPLMERIKRDGIKETTTIQGSDHAFKFQLMCYNEEQRKKKKQRKKMTPEEIEKERQQQELDDQMEEGDDDLRGRLENARRKRVIKHINLYAEEEAAHRKERDHILKTQAIDLNAIEEEEIKEQTIQANRFNPFYIRNKNRHKLLFYNLASCMPKHQSRLYNKKYGLYGDPEYRRNVLIHDYKINYNKDRLNNVKPEPITRKCLFKPSTDVYSYRTDYHNSIIAKSKNNPDIDKNKYNHLKSIGSYGLSSLWVNGKYKNETKTTNSNIKNMFIDKNDYFRSKGLEVDDKNNNDDKVNNNVKQSGNLNKIFESMEESTKKTNNNDLELKEN